MHSFVAGFSINYLAVSSADPTHIICVDDSNIDQARTSGNRGFEGSGGAFDINMENVFISGMSLEANDNLQFLLHTNILQDCLLTSNGSADIALFLSTDNLDVTLISTELNILDAGVVPVFIGNGALLTMRNVTITSPFPISVLTTTGFGGGGGTFLAYGCDFSPITGTLIANVGSSIFQDDTINVRFDMCTLASGVARTNEVFKSYNQRVLLTRCSNSSAAAEYQYGLTAFGGDVDDDSAILEMKMKLSQSQTRKYPIK